MNNIIAIILAAGQGTRFGKNASKMTALWRGEPLIRHVTRAALGSKLGHILVVTGHRADEVAVALKGFDVDFVHNETYASGMAGSLQAGVAKLPVKTDAVMVLLGDMPQVSPNLINQLIDAAPMASFDTLAIVPTISGEWGNPVLLFPSFFPAIAKLTGDQGARKLLLANAQHVIKVETRDDAILADVDTLDALQALPTRTLADD